MRMSILFFRSRRVGYSIAGLSGVTLITWIIGHILLAQPSMITDKTFIPILLFTPLAAACVVGVGTYAPCRDLEETSSYPILVLRFLHIGGLLVCGCLLLYVATSEWDLPYIDLSMIRNFLGLVGIALFASWVFGSGLSWMAPLLYIAMVQLAGQNQNGDWALWAWPAHSATSTLAGLIAMLLLIAGIATAAISPVGALNRFLWTQPG